MKQYFRLVSLEKNGELKSAKFQRKMMPFGTVSSTIEPFPTGRCSFCIKTYVPLASVKNSVPNIGFRRSLLHQLSDPPVNYRGSFQFRNL